MRNTKVYATLASVLTAILMMFILTTTVFATGELGTLTPPVDTYETQVIIDDPVVVETEVVEEPDYDFDTDEGDDNYDDGYIVETEAPTQAPTYYEVYSEELPQVESEAVTAPTTVEIPEVEVTDTSLLGGVIAWLCVAVGIAVIAGVLVSQRTRQNGTSNNRSNNRRR